MKYLLAEDAERKGRKFWFKMCVTIICKIVYNFVVCINDIKINFIFNFKDIYKDLFLEIIWPQWCARSLLDARTQANKRLDI